MRVYIFNYLETVSNNYHEGGGLVVVAKDREQVIQMVTEDPDVLISEEEWSRVVSYELKDEAEPSMHVFPDAGCC